MQGAHVYTQMPAGSLFLGLIAPNCTPILAACADKVKLPMPHKSSSPPDLQSVINHEAHWKDPSMCAPCKCSDMQQLLSAQRVVVQGCCQCAGSYMLKVFIFNHSLHSEFVWCVLPESAQLLIQMIHPIVECDVESLLLCSGLQHLKVWQSTLHGVGAACQAVPELEVLCHDPEQQCFWIWKLAACPSAANIGVQPDS